MRFIFLFVFLFGCSKYNPLDKLINPEEKSATGRWSGEFVIYDDELKTGGGIMFLSSADNQTLDFNFRENPYSGKKCIKYSWNGKSVYDYTRKIYQANWCGWAFIVGKDWTEYNKIRNFSSVNYSKISLWVRGSLSANTKIKFESYNRDTHSDIELTDSWQKIEFKITGNQSEIKEYLKIIFEYLGSGEGNGGIVYIDEIKFSK